MSTVLMCALLLAGTSSTQPLTYEKAYAQSVATNRPLLVLVGADWCPACRDLKHTTIPNMQRDGKLKSVVFTIVDLDRDPRVAEQVMRSQSIPQLVLYTPGPSGWFRFGLAGAQPPAQITAMIDRGLELQRQDIAAQSTAKTVGD